MPIAKTRLHYIILYPTVYPVGISPRARLRCDLHAWLLQLCRLRSLQVSDLQTSHLHKHYGRGHFVKRHQTLLYFVTRHQTLLYFVTRHQTLLYFVTRRQTLSYFVTRHQTLLYFVTRHQTLSYFVTRHQTLRYFVTCRCVIALSNTQLSMCTSLIERQLRQSRA